MLALRTLHPSHVCPFRGYLLPSSERQQQCPVRVHSTMVRHILPHDTLQAPVNPVRVSDHTPGAPCRSCGCAAVATSDGMAYYTVLAGSIGTG